ncbi:MAG: hypothetical protein K0R26_2647 [Bacteroidota bacterium]|jgi:hypothetical protein|nr:hypothetical protein [Bacteroidota bacterium]
MLRHIALYTITSLFCFIISCKKIGKLKEFDLHYSNEVTIPASSSIISLPFDIRTPETTTDTKDDYKNEGTTSKLIERVTLTDLTLTIQSPPGGNFDFLNSIEIFLASPNNSEVMVASKYHIPETGLSSLSLDVKGTDLKNYMQDNSFSLRLKITTDRTLSNDLTIRADETFRVKARLRNMFK